MIDVRKALKPLYSVTLRWTEIHVPPLRYLLTDETDDLNAAPETLRTILRQPVRAA